MRYIPYVPGCRNFASFRTLSGLTLRLKEEYAARCIDAIDGQFVKIVAGNVILSQFGFFLYREHIERESRINDSVRAELLSEFDKTGIAVILLEWSGWCPQCGRGFGHHESHH